MNQTVLAPKTRVSARYALIVKQWSAMAKINIFFHLWQYLQNKNRAFNLIAGRRIISIEFFEVFGYLYSELMRIDFKLKSPGDLYR